MSIVNQNIRHLRKQRGLTQEELAKALEIKRSVIGAYEEDRAEPKLGTLQKMANYFSISLDQLVGKDFTAAHAATLDAPAEAKGNKLRVLAVTVDRKDRENIELVPVKAAAGYLAGYADPEFLEELPHFHLPMLPQGTYRAFELSGESMLPLQPGTVVIGEYAEDWPKLRDGILAIVVSRNDGIVFKRIYNRIENEGRLSLHSDNPAYLPYDIPAEDVIEVWKAKAYISLRFPDSEMSLEKLAGIVLDLQKEVIKIKG
jgi:transcriptional regulator with XRE-family HTH domain